jgi:hypothetical protein
MGTTTWLENVKKLFLSLALSLSLSLTAASFTWQKEKIPLPERERRRSQPARERKRGTTALRNEVVRSVGREEADSSSQGQFTMIQSRWIS